MTLYAILEPRPGGAGGIPEAIPEKFSWYAAIFPPLFAIRHGLWLELAVFVLLVVLLSFAEPWIGGDGMWLLYGLIAVWIGFEGSALRRASLLRRGWRHRADLLADRPELAQLEWLRAAGSR